MKKLKLPCRGKRRLPDRIRGPLAIPPHLVGRLHGRRPVVRAALLHLQRQRQFQSRTTENRDQHQSAVATGGPDAGRGHGTARYALPPATERRPGVHQYDTAAVGPATRGRAAAHPAWQAHTERLHRALQPNVPHRGLAPLRFYQPTGSPTHDEDWPHRYNHQRPHHSFGRLSPVAYAVTSSTTSAE